MKEISKVGAEPTPSLSIT